MIALLLKVLMIVIAVSYYFIILYFFLGWKRLKEFKYNKEANNLPLVSIIIPARNEEDTISECLISLTKQDYSREYIEVIVVDDHSTDRTAEIVRNFAAEYPAYSIQLIQLTSESGSIAYKKRAISCAVSIAKGDIIITTDADCTFASKWVSSHVNYYKKNEVYFLSGPVLFKEETSFFGRLQSLEFLSLIGIGAAAIGAGNPLMCNGANLSFKKDVFEKVGGYTGNENIASGDDVFLMHKVMKRFPGKVNFLKSREAIVYTSPQENLNAFVEQRKRWASKSSSYTDLFSKAVAVITYMFNLLLIICGVVSLFSYTFAKIFLVAFGLKVFTDLVFLIPVTSFFRERRLLYYFLVEQLLYSFYIVYIGATGTLSKYKWKGREVK